MPPWRGAERERSPPIDSYGYKLSHFRVRAHDVRCEWPACWRFRRKAREKVLICDSETAFQRIYHNPIWTGDVYGLVMKCLAGAYKTRANVGYCAGQPSG